MRRRNRKCRGLRCGRRAHDGPAVQRAERALRCGGNACREVQRTLSQLQCFALTTKGHSSLNSSIRLGRNLPGFHSTMSPPHDHDLNPIAERAIGVISDLACCIRGHSGAPRGLWPHVIEHAVNIHNSTSSSCGTSSAESMVSAYQRLTLAQPSVMDIASFGCMAVALKSPPHRNKTDLSSRGWVGKFNFGSSWVALSVGKKANGMFSLMAKLSLAPRFKSTKNTFRGALPIPSNLFARRDRHLLTRAGGVTPSISSLSDRDSLRCLNLFSGPYTRAEGISKRLKGQFSWKSVIDMDNDPDTCGGWDHDLLNDETFARILGMASNGTFDAIMVAFPCSTFSASRFFPSDPPTRPSSCTYPCSPGRSAIV